MERKWNTDKIWNKDEELNKIPTKEKKQIEKQAKKKRIID